MEIHRTLVQGPVLLDLPADDLRSALERTVDQLVESGQLSGALRERVLGALLAREIEAPTAIGASVAVPHAHIDALPKPFLAFVRLAKPLDLRAADGEPTRFLFVLLGPTGAVEDHLRTLMKIARLMQDTAFREEAIRARNREELIAAYERYKARIEQALPKPSGTVPASLQPTGKLFGGIRRDLRGRLPFYGADFRDGLSVKVLASVLFMYFACLAPAVAFGGLMALMTEGSIGIVAMLVATAVCGIIYALASAQPLTILAGTGPLLIFTGILYELTGHLSLPFLPVYGWVGLWTALLLILVASLDGCTLIRFITRFTSEIFAALIALIFIAEAIGDLMHVFTDRNISDDTALLSLLLALGTYYIAMSLARFRRSPFLRHTLREFLADFGPAIAIAAMTLVSVVLSRVELRALPVPASIEVRPEHLRAIDLFSVPSWVILASLGPAILATVLIFLNQNITTRLVDAPENKLTRPTGYHWNLALVGVLVGGCSLFGLPWLMASLIPSLNHLRSLARVEEVANTAGRIQERVTRVAENRLSPLLIHGLLALSLILLPVLRTIPMAVIFGLFLYMGIASLATNQFFERIKLWLMDPALYPPTHYIRKLPIRTVHQYTLIQAACLVVLWLVKASPVAILFPLLVALLVPFRLQVLPHVMDSTALRMLDDQATDRTIEDPPASIEWASSTAV